MSRELKSCGANINLVPKSESIPLEIGGIDYNPLRGQGFLVETDLSAIKEIFWRNNIVGFAPFLKTPVQVSGREQPVQLIGTWFDRHQPVANEPDYRTGVREINPFWEVTGRWPEDQAIDALNSEEYDRWYCAAYVSTSAHQVAEVVPNSTARPFWQVEGRWINVVFDEENCLVGRFLARNMQVEDRVTTLSRETGFNKSLAAITRGAHRPGRGAQRRMIMKKVLEMSRLTKRFGNVAAVDGIPSTTGNGPWCGGRRSARSFSRAIWCPA